MGPLRVVVVISVALIFSTSSTAAFATETASCTFTTFNAPSGYTLNAVRGINDDGTVVGQLINNDTQAYAGFMLSSKGTYTIYNAPGSSMTWMYGDNAAGSSTGSYMDKKSAIHGFFLVGGDFSEVNHPNAKNTWLFDLNKVGAAVGSYAEGTTVKGFLLENGAYSDIAYPDAQSTYPMALNDNNVVVGSYSSGSESSGFLWQSGTFTTINYPKAGAPYGTALSGINNDGLIVGNRLLADGDDAFIYENGVFEKIAYAGAKYTIAGGINNNGVISGQVYMNATDTFAFTAVCK